MKLAFIWAAASVACFLVGGVMSAPAATFWYVSPAGSDLHSGLSLEEAFQTLQYAILQSSDGDCILADVGVYDQGSESGHPVGSSLPSRVAIYKAVLVESLWGAAFTFIDGQQNSPASPCGPAAMRCVYMTNGAQLRGFTLRQGHTGNTVGPDEYGGGIYAEGIGSYVYDCVIQDCGAFYSGGGAYGGVYYRSRFSRNVVAQSGLGYGGGAAYALLYSCQLVSNAVANNILGFFSSDGGGAYYSTLYNCLVEGNSVLGGCGGGLYGCTAYDAVIRNNQVTLWTADDSYLYRGYGGGAYGGQLFNCTVAGNSAQKEGGGVARVTNAANCIVVDNQATLGHANHFETWMAYSCSQPTPAGGAGNISDSPQFVDASAGNYHLGGGSLCRNAGIYAGWMDTWPWDYDKNARVAGAAVDMGAYEYFDAPFDLTSLAILNGLGVVVGWQSVSGRLYHLERSTNLESGFTEVLHNIPGLAGYTAITDTSAVVTVPNFYRVRPAP